MSDHTITVTGVPPEWRSDVKDRILEALALNKATYPLTSFRWSTDELEVVDTITGLPAEGAQYAISLPTLESFVGRSGNLLIAISASLQGFMVTIFADGVVQAALNGEILR